MSKTLPSVRDTFAQQCKDVRELLEFDDVLVEHLIGGLSWIVEDLRESNQRILANAAENRLKALKNVRAAGSLRPRYETIYNQCVVLLVSYFDASMSDLFRIAVAMALRANAQVPARKRSVQVSWNVLQRSESRVEALIADRIVDEDNVSFQDMQSIRRAFSKNLDLDLGRDASTNDVILGQACRHALAHAGGRVDDRLLNQVAGVTPRRLKTELVAGENITFDPAEVRALGSAMADFIDTAIQRVDAAFGSGIQTAG